MQVIQVFRDSWREAGLPPLSKISPLLNQHKYYKEAVLKHKQQQSGSCCSKKRYAPIQKIPRIFPRVYSSCQNIGNRHCFLVGGGGGGARWFPPPFRKILYETLLKFRKLQLFLADFSHEYVTTDHLTPIACCPYS